MELSSLFLRFSALVLCFISAITLATQPAKRAGSPSSFPDSPELISLKVFPTSPMELYLSFILEQMLAYLLISSSSLGLQSIQRRDNAQALRRAAIVSVTMSFAAFSVMAACTLLSGYKLCKRIIWW